MLFAALAAGIVAIAVTVAIERFGGVVGGLLGTLPTTIVPATAGIWAASADLAAFELAMAAVPAGMLADALFLWAWRVLPPRLQGSLEGRLAMMLAASLAWWALWAAVFTVGLRAGLELGGRPLWWGLGFLLANIGIGVVACLRPRDAPKGTRTVSVGVLLARGGLAAVAIAGSVALAEVGSPVLAGVASVFPAIFLTTMVSLWWSQGEAVPVGAVGPMMLGASAVGAFALLAVWTIPALGVAAGSAVAWVVAALTVTAPAYAWMTVSRAR